MICVANAIQSDVGWRKANLHAVFPAFVRTLRGNTKQSAKRKVTLNRSHTLLHHHARYFILYGFPGKPDTKNQHQGELASP
jgi:hypothetical protein